jgi:protein-S-isoprenylcysteine O-methyltransferase Ste14
VKSARYFIAVLLLVTLPSSIGLWYAIHPFAHLWRRLGAGWTYLLLGVPCIGLGWSAWRFRSTLVGRDLGTQPVLWLLALVAAIAGASIALQRRKHLSQRILVGVPELSRTDKGRLLTEGIYAKVRNPRYLELIAFVLAYASFANYAGTWALAVVMLPAIHVVVLLEEAELRARFGAEYEDYCSRVPRYLPSKE